MQELMQEITELEDEEALRKAVRHALHEDTAAIKPHLVERILHYRLVEHPQRDAAWQAQAAAATEYEAASRLGDVSMPTLIVQPQEDKVVDPRNAELMADRIPDARVCKIEGSGHLVFWEEPRRFAEEVIAFLTEEEPGEGEPGEGDDQPREEEETAVKTGS
jgi:3-oxoadipate enol-lactonase